MYFTPDLKKQLQIELFAAATEKRDLAKIRRLLRSGLVDIAAVDNKGHTVLSHVCNNLAGFIGRCVDVSELHEIINMLATAETVCKKPEFGNSPLYKLAFCTEDYAGTMFRILLEKLRSSSLADKLLCYAEIKQTLTNIRHSYHPTHQANVILLNHTLSSLLTDQDLQELQANLIKPNQIVSAPPTPAPAIKDLAAEIQATKAKLQELEALSKSMPNNTFTPLPEELLLHSFRFSSPRDLANLSRTCKTFYRLANDPNLALDKARRRWELRHTLVDKRVDNISQLLTKWKATDELPEAINLKDEDDRLALAEILLKHLDADIKFIAVVDKLLEKTEKSPKLLHAENDAESLAQ